MTDTVSLRSIRFWGASTSAFQVEGDTPPTQWGHFLADNAKRLAEEAGPKTDWGNGAPSPVWDEIAAMAKDPASYLPGKAADFYHRYGEDMKLARDELGHNAIRFSIEWARVQPRRGQIDRDAVEHYRRMIRTARRLGLEPFVGLWHWTEPDWFTELGGWENAEAPQIFAEEYVRPVVEALANELTYVIVLNETEVYAGQSYVNGVWPPAKKSLRANGKVMKYLVEAYRRSYDVIKSINRLIQVSAAVNLSAMETVGGWRWPWSELCRWGGERAFNGTFLRKTVDKMDWIGLNYYMRFRFGHLDPRKPLNDAPAERLNDLGWELYPQGLYKVLMMLKRYAKPVIITEHGLADHRDDKRGRYINQSLQMVGRAIADGVPVVGYLHWSLLDNIEWDKGRWPRFGLVAVNYTTQERTVRPSAYEYRKIIEARRVELT